MRVLCSALLIIIFSSLPINSIALEEVSPPLAGITNFLQYSSNFASSGQPTREQFQTIADNGFERIVYIAFTNDQNALSDADQLINVKKEFGL